jgi:hypothetical protein
MAVKTVILVEAYIARKEKTGKPDRFVCLLGGKGKVLPTFFTAQQRVSEPTLYGGKPERSGRVRVLVRGIWCGRCGDVLDREHQFTSKSHNRRL